MEKRPERITAEEKMDEIYNSYKYLIYERLNDVDRMMARISSEGAWWKVDEDYIREYLRTRTTDLIDKIAEQREAEHAKKGGRKKKTR